MKNSYNCKAAFAQTDITPDFPVELIGAYRPDSTAKGVQQPLMAQALVLEQDGARYCLITIDSLGLTTTLGLALRERVAAEIQTSIGRVMLSFSHTHSAPAPLSPLNGERYFRLLSDRTAACAKEATERLAPCLAGWAMGEAGIAENRREGCTAVDNRLGALHFIHAETGAPLGIVLRVSAHANVLMEQNDAISSDFFGPAREKLAARFGCPAMLVQGACGNLKPMGVDKMRGGSIADVQRIADTLDQAASRLHFDHGEITRLSMLQRDIMLYSSVPSKEEAERIAREALAQSGVDGRAWLKECARLRDEGVTTQKLEESIQFLFINGGCLCGLPDELFCEISIDASARADAPLLFLNGYTNGCTGYLPHRAEWIKGGYETLHSYLTFYPFHGHVMPFAPDTAERITDAVLEIWNEAKP